MSEDVSAEAVPPEGVEVTSWWAALAGTALLGTARAAVPPWPAIGVAPHPGASREDGLLDAVAVAGALVLAGRPLAAEPGGAADATPCEPDRCPPAPDAAVQLLRLALAQPPVGRELHDTVLVRWLRAAARARRAAPHELLPALLTAANGRPALREALRVVLDERGRWLAARRPDWAWALVETGAAVPDDEEWSRAATGDRPAVLRRIRAADPARGRALAARAFAGAGAKERAAIVEALVVGLGADDEDLLMTALTDRAKAVGQAAVPLLDALPGSARGARLGAGLAAALSVHGRLSPRLEVAELPPLDGAVRAEDAPQVGSAGWLPWALEQAVAGAPLDVLAQATGTDPAGVLRLDKDGLLRPGVRRAVLARRDVAWARALLASGWDATVAAVLPREEHEAAVAAQLRRAAADMAALVMVGGVPRPWGEAFGRAVLDWCVRGMGTADRPVALVLDAVTLGTGLDAAAAEPVRRAVEAAQAAEAAAARAVARHGPPDPAATPATPSPAAREAAAALSTARHNLRVLRDVAQLLSFTRSIDEAFS